MGSIPHSPLSLYHGSMNILIDLFTELGRTVRLGAQWFANLLKDHSDDPVAPGQSTTPSETEKNQ